MKDIKYYRTGIRTLKEEDIMVQTKESSWTVKHEEGSVEVVVEAVHADIPKIVDDILNVDILDPKNKLGKIARSNVFKLKVRGFSLLALREEFANRKQGCIDEFFPVQASFHVERKHYIVEFSDRKAFARGQVLE